MTIKSQKTNKSAKCPHCGNKNNAAINSDLEDIKPEENDISICYYCSKVSKYNIDLTLRVLTKEETKELEDSEDWAIISEFQTFIQGRNG